MILMTLFLLSLSPQGHSSQVRGVVQDSRGRERVGAEVVFVSSPIPGVREAQVLRAKTGKRGRFHVRLSPGRVYRGWSHFKDGKGENYFSPIQTEVVSGKVLVLKENRSRPSQILHLKNLSAWGKPEEMELRWNLDGEMVFVLKEHVNSKGEARIPDLIPGAFSRLEFVLARKKGRALFSGRVSLKKETGGPIFSFASPTPLSLPIQVWEKEGKKPIHGASLYIRFGYSSWYPLGKTDEKGQARFKVAEFRRGHRPLAIAAQKEGFKEANIFANHSYTSVQGKYGAYDPKNPLRKVTLALETEEPLGGRVLGWDGKGIPGAVLHWKAQAAVRKQGPSTWTQVGRKGFLRAEEKGGFSLSFLPSNLAGLDLSLYLPEEKWKELAGGSSAHSFPENALIHRHWFRLPKPGELVFDCRKLRLLPFRIQGPDGAPVLFPSLRWKVGYKASVSTRGDRKGRGFLLVPLGKVSFFGFEKEAGYFIGEKTEVKEKEGFVLPEKVIQFKAFPGFLKGKVVDSEGRPLQGVRIEPEGWSMSSPGARSYLVYEMDVSLLRGKTDSEGRFKLPLLEDPHLKLTLGFRKGKMVTKLKVVGARNDLKVVLK